MASVHTITSESYHGFIQSAPLALIHCWATWDVTHSLMQRRIHSAICYSGLCVQVGMWDSDHQASQKHLKELLEQVHILCVPTLLYHKNGKLAFGVGGNRSDQEISESIQRLYAL